MNPVLMYADTLRSPELRHEVRLPAPDPMIYVEHNGTRRVFAGSLEIPRLEEVDGLAPAPFEALGSDELIAAGMSARDREPELVLRACLSEGIQRAVVPGSFPVGVADHLRANGIEIEVDTELFDRRRRAKNDAELAGIRRAVRASEQAFARAREVLASRSDVSCEDLRAEVARVFTEAGVITPDPPIISHGAQTAVGHEPGHGLILAHEPVVLDLYPQDPESGCYSDMTRTFCIGTPPAELAGYADLCREALERVLPEVRPGVSGAELHRIASEVFSEAGHPTQLTKAPGEPLDRGFFHSLGHGVGLEVHEEPGLGRSGTELVAGDVLAIEPGCYRPGFGGCRLEDLVLVTEDGCELLTRFPYDLEV
jgi:Xaa-Pro aminopeptidase